MLANLPSQFQSEKFGSSAQCRNQSTRSRRKKSAQKIATAARKISHRRAGVSRGASGGWPGELAASGGTAALAWASSMKA